MIQDFIIIGGGIAGISAAARLSQLGSVTLLEAEDALGYHASGRSAATFELGYGAPPTVALNRASEPYHMTANGGVLGPRGILVLGRNEDRAAFEQDVHDMGLTRLDVDEARAMVPILNPDTVALAAISTDARDLDTDRLMQNFAREARANGAQLHTGARVGTITRSASGWRLTTGNGSTVEGHYLINAAGAWADMVAQLAGLPPIGIRPLRRSMARLPAPGGQDVRHWPMIMGAGETWYAKPDAGKWLVSPADEDPVEPHDAWADDLVLAEGIARYQEMVREPVTRVEGSWAGLRSFAPDRTLVIGPDPLDPGFAWLAGQGGQGFQSAPAASRLLADRIAARSPQLNPALVAALAPERFR